MNGSATSLILLLQGTLLVSIVILTEVGAIASLKFLRERRERSAAMTRTHVVEILVDALESERPVQLPAPRGLAGYATREAFMALIATLSGSARKRLISLAESHGYVGWSLRDLHSRSPATRARGCMILGGMLSPTASDALLERFRIDRDANVRLTAIEALAEIGTMPIPLVLTEAASPRTTWQQLRVANAIARMGENAVPALAASLSSPDERIVRLCLDLLCDIGTLREITRVVSLVRHPSAEVRGRAAALLGILGAVDAIDQVLDAARDGVWFVRVRAARSLQRLGVPDNPKRSDRYFNALQALLSDESWWVRQRAAEALADGGERGRRVLSSSTSDAAAAALQLHEMREPAG